MSSIRHVKDDNRIQEREEVEFEVVGNPLKSYRKLKRFCDEVFHNFLGDPEIPLFRVLLLNEKRRL